jgi:hypothetical protein
MTLQTHLKGLKTPPQRPTQSPLALEDQENKAFWENENKLNPSKPACKVYDSQANHPTPLRIGGVLWENFFGQPVSNHG